MITHRDAVFVVLLSAITFTIVITSIITTNHIKELRKISHLEKENDSLKGENMAKSNTIHLHDSIDLMRIAKGGGDTSRNAMAK